MKTLRTLIGACIALATTQTAAQTLNADAILGTYLNPDRSRTVEVYKSGDRYFGVITSAPEVPDGNEGIGFVVFKDFVFNSQKGLWENGQLDSPMTPRIAFSGILSLDGAQNRVVRGFVRIPALGGSSVFTKVRGPT